MVVPEKPNIMIKYLEIVLRLLPLLLPTEAGRQRRDRRRKYRDLRKLRKKRDAGKLTNKQYLAEVEAIQQKYINLED